MLEYIWYQQRLYIYFPSLSIRHPSSTSTLSVARIPRLPLISRLFLLPFRQSRSIFPPRYSLQFYAIIDFALPFFSSYTFLFFFSIIASLYFNNPLVFFFHVRLFLAFLFNVFTKFHLVDFGLSGAFSISLQHRA